MWLKFAILQHFDLESGALTDLNVDSLEESFKALDARLCKEGRVQLQQIGLEELLQYSRN